MSPDGSMLAPGVRRVRTRGTILHCLLRFIGRCAGRSGQLTSILFLLLSVQDPFALADCGWQEFSSAPYQNPAFPETNATYLRIAFPASSLRGETLVMVRGSVGDARYVAFTAYEPITNRVMGHVSDDQLALRDGNYDLFIGTHDAIQRAKQLLVGRVTDQDAFNFLELGQPESGVRPRTRRMDGAPVEVWYRNYLGSNDEESAPDVQLVSIGTDGFVRDPACPAPLSVPAFPAGAVATIPPMNHRHEIKFFRSRGEMLYPNPDNFYVASRINPRAGHVATISFRPPPPGSMRYWSICLGGLNTTTSGCLYDRQILEANGLDPDAAQDPEVRVRVMFAPESWRHHAARSNMAFLPWGTHRREFIIYRNLLTVDSHPGNMGRVPPIRRSHLIPCRIFCRNWDRISAEKFIGDWAPVGWQQ